MDNLVYFIGLIVGLLVGLVCAALAIRYCRGSWKSAKSKYDERQKIAMGKAYRDGFWVLLAGVVCANCLTKIPGIEEYSGMLFTTACFIGIEVYVIGCIMRDAYMGLNDNAKKWTIVFVILGLINLIGAVNFIKANGLAAGWTNLMCVILIVSVLIVYGIRSIVKKRELEDQED